MKIRYHIILACFICLLFAPETWASSTSTISVSGLVKQPLNLSMETIGRYQNVRVQLNEIMRDGTFRGVFYYQGVPLRALLETASIEKKDSDFKKNIDLAVLIQDSKGNEVVLSWGEIFYRNSADIIIATSATPIMPHHGCSSCHDQDFYKPYMDQLSRPIGFPKLVVACDACSDRSLEEVVSIRVLYPRPNVTGDRSKKLFSPSFTVTGAVKKEKTFNDLSSYTRRGMKIVTVGEGKGFHGIGDYSGATFKSIIEEAGIGDNLCTVFHVSAPDGYRSLFSYGEAFLNRTGDRMFIADTMDGSAIEEGGRFFLIPADDLMADRDIKSVEKIEVISLGQNP